MMNTLQKTMLKLGVSKGDAADEVDKKRLNELRESNEAAKKAWVALLKTHAEHNAHIDTLHECFGDLYPAAQAYTGHIEALLEKSEHFKNAKIQMDEAKMSMDKALADVAVLQKNLYHKVEERAGFRQDIAFFTGAIEKLKPKVALNPKDAPKLAENEAKLGEATRKFESADAAIQPELAKLDTDIANLTTAAIQLYLEAHFKFLYQTSKVLADVVNGVPAAGAGAAAV